MGRSWDDVEDRLADFTRDRRIVLLSALALVVGVIAAFAALALVRLIGLVTNLAYFGRLSAAFVEPGAAARGWGVLVPVAGGLAIGLLARFGSDKIRGHGIPEAIEAILVGRSRMSLRVALLKPLASAISIGTGGPFGAEGPIIMTGGALGSLFAQGFHLSSAERKTLLVAGAAGGMAAIFASPLAAILLAVELLLFEWRPRSFIPVAISATVAAALRVPLLGPGPVFPVPPHVALGGLALLPAFLLGLLAGAASGLLTALVYGFEDLFERLPVHWMWWPALGGLAVGLGGLVEPRALGVGYGSIHALLRGELPAADAARLLAVKAVLWAFALGSGTSGGVLAPLLLFGGALGALAAPLVPLGDTGAWALVGMAAMMGGTMRSPLTAILFALELTHDFGLLPVLVIGCIAAHGLTVLLLRRSILTEKVSRKGHHVFREYALDPLTRVRVAEVMDRDPVRLPAELPLRDLLAALARRDPAVTRRMGKLVTGAGGRLLGVITQGDVLRALERDPAGAGTVLEVATPHPIVAHPDESLHDVVARMLRHGVGRLPVVARRDGVVVGYLGRAEVLAGRKRVVDEEGEREPGWLPDVL